MEYDASVCPRTLDVLRRTFFALLNPDWTEEEIAERIEAFRQAGERVAQMMATV